MNHKINKFIMQSELGHLEWKSVESYFLHQTGFVQPKPALIICEE